MNAGEALLQHARLDGQVRGLESEIERISTALASSAAIDGAQARLEVARDLQKTAALRVRDREREVEDHRTRMHKRDRELMSGRINNPTELTKLSAEVEHMKARIAEEEEAELALMEEAERADADVHAAESALASAREAAESAAPGLRSRLQALQAELDGATGERDRVWEQVPADYRAAAGRIRATPPVAEVSNNQCGACHVQLTSSAIQALRRSGLRTCDNCGRILVLG